MDGARRMLGQEDPLTLALASSYAADLRARGDFLAAQNLDEVTVQLYEQIRGGRDSQSLRAKNNLALDYGLTSDYKRPGICTRAPSCCGVMATTASGIHAVRCPYSLEWPGPRGPAARGLPRRATWARTLSITATRC